MRYLALAAAAFLASCGPDFDGCQNVCERGQAGNVQFLCNGAPCQPGFGTATQFDQCLCTTASGQLQSFVYPDPQNPSECDSARASWNRVADVCR